MQLHHREQVIQKIGINVVKSIISKHFFGTRSNKQYLLFVVSGGASAGVSSNSGKYSGIYVSWKHRSAL